MIRETANLLIGGGGGGLYRMSLCLVFLKAQILPVGRADARAPDIRLDSVNLVFRLRHA